MSKLEKDVHDAIAAHLPQQVAGQLRDVLKDYDTLKGKVDALELSNEILSKGNQAANDELAKFRVSYHVSQSDKDNLEKRQLEAEQRDRDLDGREMRMELEMARRALALESAARCKIEEFMLNMSRVPVYKRTVLQERSHVIEGDPGLVDNSGYVHQSSTPGRLETKTDETTETVETE